MKNHAILLAAVLLGLLSALSYAQAAIPYVSQPLVPAATAPGGPQFTLTVNGTGFAANSVVNWNGSPLATQFVTGSQLTATVPAADIATASTASVTVVSPAPGGGTSNVAFFPITPNSGIHVGFESAIALPYQFYYPDSIAVGDFNGDGKLDLAICNQEGGDLANTLFVLLGDGAGNFTLASSFATGRDPVSVVVGDFNGDGRLDLAVSNLVSGTISIMLGDGTGSFTLFSSVFTNNGSEVAVGDFNGDGKLDLAVTSFNGDFVSILLGDGTGNFNLASTVFTGDNPSSIGVGDFNGDGILDLVVTNYESYTVSILLGDGKGNFAPAPGAATGDSPSSAVVGDFNGDGKLDLAITNFWGKTLTILLGDGTGNFTAGSSPTVGLHGGLVVTGDFNGDGNLDLAVVGGYGEIVILLGDGAGNFVPTSSPAFNRAWTLAVGDFNGDGKLDLAVSNYALGGVFILLQGKPAPVAVLSTASLNFGEQLKRTESKPQNVTLTNTGSATLDISGIVASTNFQQNNNCGSSLPAGKHCTIAVAFLPGGVGKKTGTITISDNAWDKAQAVALTGVSTALTLSTSSVNFGNQTVGTTSSAQTVTLTSYAANRVVPIYNVMIRGNNTRSFTQTNTCGTGVPEDGSCTFTITFTPQFKGTKTATLYIWNGGGDTPLEVTLAGDGT